MVSYMTLRMVKYGLTAVLILIVVDNGLVQKYQVSLPDSVEVLILIVVDNGLVLGWLPT